jgi:hypothetical protein
MTTISEVQLNGWDVAVWCAYDRMRIIADAIDDDDLDAESSHRIEEADTKLTGEVFATVHTASTHDAVWKRSRVFIVHLFGFPKF